MRIPLALALAARELRGGVRGFRVFLTCLALGVGAIAGVGGVGQAVLGGLDRDARRLLGGDVDVRLESRDFTPEQRAYFDARADRRSHVVEMRAMAHSAAGADRFGLVEVKAVDGAYPLTGAVDLAPAMPLEEALEPADRVFGAVAEAGLLDRLRIAVGDTIRLGDAEFQVRATVASEPDRVASMLSFGPRLLIAADALDATGLVLPGSRISHHMRVVLPEGTDPAGWIAALAEAFPGAGWRVRGADDAAPGLRRFVERFALFLGFVGLTTLLVGGVGVANAVSAYLDGKGATIATLKCVGAPSRLIFRLYLAQVLALAVIGIAIGLIVGGAAPPLVLAALAEHLPVAPEIGVKTGPLAVAAAFGILVAVTFALWPLMRAREVRAAALFRGVAQPRAGRPSLCALWPVAAGVALLAALTVATAVDRRFALWFVAGAAAALVLLRLGAAVLMAVARRLPPPRRAEPRLAIANLHRPGAATTGVVLSLGLGLAVLVAVAEIQGNLDREIAERLPDEAPAFFFIDIQPEQVEAFDRVVASVPGARDLQRVPTLRGRIVAIGGVPVERASIAADAEWAVRGDRALTYAAAPAPGTRLVAGTWWPPDHRGSPLISLDANLARGFGIGVGDTLTLNVLGREVEARVASLREIDWHSLRFDFAIIFAPGFLEGAPHSHVAAVKASRGAEAAVEQAVAGAFANVSVIRVREALEAAAAILAGIGAGVRGTAAVAILAGAVVLAGAVAAGRRRRTYDAVVLKVLGATRGRLLAAFLLEYGALGLVTGAVAAAVGTLTAWAVVVHLMGIGWRFLPGTALATLAVALVVSVTAGFAGTWRALGAPAAPYLRNE